jgi:formylglycine-generating enzyme required for sulfatase activity
MVDPGRANYGATKLERTSTVGCFEDGKSPYGLYDMCGNVWEWTRSNWGTSPDKPQYRYPYVSHDKREDMQASEGMLKVIRGGSCHSPLEDIRCYRRGADFPMARREHIGFRLAITLLEQQGVKSGNAI